MTMINLPKKKILLVVFPFVLIFQSIYISAQNMQFQYNYENNFNYLNFDDNLLFYNSIHMYQTLPFSKNEIFNYNSDFYHFNFFSTSSILFYTNYKVSSPILTNRYDIFNFLKNNIIGIYYDYNYYDIANKLITSINTYVTSETNMNGKIHGIVYDYMSLEPIKNALVGVKENDIRVATNANGEYIIKHIGNGEYTIFAEINEYLRQEKIAVVTDGGTLSLNFALVKKPKTGEIAGIVLDIETSNPVDDATIQLIGSCNMQTKTDDTGQFLFEEVPEGEYEIITQKACYQTKTSSITVTHDMITTIEFLLFWQYTKYMYDEDFREIMGLFDNGTIITYYPTLQNGIFMLIYPKLLTIQCDETSAWPDCLPEDQKTILLNFNSKGIIAVARDIKNNDNEKLFYHLTDPLRINYESKWLEEINSYMNLGWRYPEFHYIEKRKFENRGTSSQKIIITPAMVVNENKSITLEEGTYFFDSLILKPGATITTKGNVKIYITSLKLEKGARLMGGSIYAPEPERLIILGEYWTGYPFDSQKNKISIGSDAEVHGYIIAPNLTLYMTRGTSKQTVLHGGALVYRFITLDSNSSNNQWIIIEKGCFCPSLE